MSGRRIKNLILLILALAVCFLLLAVVPGKLSAQREESALHQGTDGAAGKLRRVD